MKTIPLTQGLGAIVDDEDFEQVNALRWFPVKPSPRSTTFYAYANVMRGGKRTSVSMHRLLFDYPASQVDHVDGNGLNNLRHNLRLATPRQNAMNRGINKNNTTGVKGVCRRTNGTYAARITVDNKSMHLGTFVTAESAGRVYDEWAKAASGEFAGTNG